MAASLVSDEGHIIIPCRWLDLHVESPLLAVIEAKRTQTLQLSYSETESWDECERR